MTIFNLSPMQNTCLITIGGRGAVLRCTLCLGREPVPPPTATRGRRTCAPATVPGMRGAEQPPPAISHKPFHRERLAFLERRATRRGSTTQPSPDDAGQVRVRRVVAERRCGLVHGEISECKMTVPVFIVYFLLALLLDRGAHPRLPRLPPHHDRTAVDSSTRSLWRTERSGCSR